jgi:hypothetical protein
MVTGTHAGFVDPSLPTAAHEWKRGRPPAPAAGNYWRTPVDDGPQLA